ncbi:2'-5' RNA ligase [Serinicoccus hydrothermalis]|uniref:RNA 2',3'-cyclic phosphodiesterase n=1 Tax=Serinicoccus hydrothermalis TaxID=1758689 RepID=A0A1B1NE33_9MICO|nr:RNA 2',3'-cyclic phosphodiesterase [Serinicoccus hydrothermalis]ANS79697.1 2'-5' RNA ligase [Serinicoccus hydrothermalis]
MRAFIALIPPAPVGAEIDDFLEPRQDALAPRGDWRWTRPEHRHVTLAFLPELEEWREEALIEEGMQWAARAQPVRLTLRGAGAFPDPGAAKVLWAAVEQADPGSLQSWAQSLRALSSRAGARVDGTRFSPHLTLARSVGRPRAAGHLVQALDTLHTSSWTATEVCLVRSELGQGPGGTPRYAVRHTWSLR